MYLCEMIPESFCFLSQQDGPRESQLLPSCMFVCVCMCVYLYWAPQQTSGVPSVIRPVPMKVGSNIPQQTSGVPLVIQPVPIMVGSNIPEQTSGVPSVIQPVSMMVGSNIPEVTSGVILVIRQVPVMLGLHKPEETLGVPFLNQLSHLVLIMTTNLISKADTLEIPFAFLKHCKNQRMFFYFIFNDLLCEQFIISYHNSNLF